MSIKNVSILVIICLVIGVAAGSKLFPESKVEIREVEKEVIKRDVVTQVRTITRPDGTKEESTVITDRSTENKESSSSTTVAKLDWHVSASVSKNSLSSTENIYGIQVERLILSNLYLGVKVDSNKQVGATVGISF